MSISLRTPITDSPFEFPDGNQYDRPTSGNQLWLRKWSLMVGVGGSQIDLSGLHFTFKVTKPPEGSPWSLEAHVWNVGDKEVKQLIEQFTGVTLYAGYQPPSNQYGLIFNGASTWYKAGRENATDSFVDLNAFTQDVAINGATVNQRLEAGHTHKDVIQACVDSMPGVSLGYVSDLGSEQMPRARTLYGMARDPIRDICQAHDASWHIDDNQKLNIVTSNDAMPGQVVQLSSKSGLIGWPSQTMGGGVEIRSLLNPLFLPETIIQLNETQVTQLGVGKDSQGIPQKQFAAGAGTQPLSTDGYYKIKSVIHQGDNRGNPWYSELTCISANPNEQTGFPKVGAPVFG